MGKNSTGNTHTVGRTSHELLRVAFASAPEPVVLVDGEGIVAGWNTAAQNRYGWTAPEVVGLPLAPMVPTGEREALRSASDAVLRGGVSPPFPVSFIAKDGQLVRAPVRLWLVSLGDDDLVVIATGDDDGFIVPSERVAAERFRRIFASAVFGVCCGVHDRVTQANAAFLHTIGSDFDGLHQGLALGKIFGKTSLHGPLVDGAGREFEVTRVDGSDAHVFAAVMSHGTDAGWVAITFDVTERKAAERAAAHLALHDPITGLPNNRLLREAVEQALARALRRDRHVALLFCDVDLFKGINDSYGHRVGDEILRTVARRIESVLRGDDIVARVGGDEFVVVLQELGDVTEATRVAERARLAIAHPVELDDAEKTTIRVTASIGVAVSSTRQCDSELLLRRADNAMYVAKQQGRDRIAFADDPLGLRSKEAQ
jgi:diguanylate cyclase (GGDEF)-like protein/PAS domain S-box-containing protein